MYKIKNLTIVVLTILSFNALAQFGGPSPVKVAKVQELMMAPIRKVPAMVEAKFVAKIKTESKGIVSEIADVGSELSKGDVLAILIDSQARLKTDELNGAVKSSEAKLDYLQSENKRLTDLVGKNLISDSELEQNKSDLISARNDLVQSKSRLNQFLDQVTKLVIKAPYAGVVMQQLATPGQLLNASEEVLEFMQANNLEIVVNIPFKYKSQIKPNALWRIETSDGKLIDAHIKRFVPAARGQSHTIEVRLLVTGNELWSGEAVNVWLPTQASKKVVAVPRDALVIRKNGSYIFTVVENKANKVNVITGMAQGDLIEVRGLLSDGDTVIVRGNERMRNQQDVKILK
ncbi:MAG TPA: efflux RND transporter periplasmic adaptor subunit [Oceanospirillales bacterium]|nr:efflux RND transporter periplasmic adaptor subunit [Oceanospirillales bacterium]